MPSPAPVTQRDVAQACGLHPSTICLALGNSPSIPAATRERVQAMARKLGYQPNAAARNLAFLRVDKAETARLPLAWINQEPQRGFWRTHPIGRLYFEAARQRAEESGYYLEEFWIHEPGMRLARLIQIIAARGVQGVVFPIYQTLDPAVFAALWDEFATVSFNDQRAAEWLDVVCADSYHNFDLTLRQVRARGFRRVGLVLSPAIDATTDGLGCCRYLRFQNEQLPTERIPVCMLASDEAVRVAQVRAWSEEHRPEVILFHSADRGSWLAAVDPDIVRATWGALGGEGMAGMDEQAGLVAHLAIDCLSDKVRRFERGLGRVTRRHLVKGSWRDHASLGRRLQGVA